MLLFGIVPVLLYLSALINIGLVWYIRKILIKNNYLEEDIITVSEKLNLFADHLESIYELEMFYGDETLETLLDHSKELINDFVDFQIQHFEAEEELETEENSEETISEEE
tara:strand:- start:1086 stop:1418 length:333 start_codon:yes stop_codon:yes gene_type:complete